jgi:hypothetical protein
MTLLRIIAALTACLMLCSASAIAGESAISVKETGAIGDGKADDTAAFEAAVARSRETGLPVSVPPGRYRVTRTLVLKAQSLRGAETAAWVADDVSMPTIVPEAKDGPCIRLLGGASVHGLHFSYNWAGKEPGPTPPTIELAGVGCRVTEVKIQGAWDAIASDGKNNVGRAHIERCFIVDVHNVGLRLTGTWDSSWVSKVEVWSPASKSFPVSGVGFQFGKNDVLIVSDCFVFRAQLGYQLLAEIPGCEIKGITWGTFSNCTSDLCSTGVLVDGGHTVSFVGGTHWTHFGGLIVRGKDAQVRAGGVEFAANGGPAVAVEDGEIVTVSGCQLRRKAPGFDSPALRITGGESVAVTGCVITSGTKALEIKEGHKGTALTGNIVNENVDVQ